MKKMFILLVLLIPVTLSAQEYAKAASGTPFTTEKQVSVTNDKATIYISAWVEYFGPYCNVYLSASQSVTSAVTVDMRASGGLGHFSMRIPNGSSSAQQMFLVPGDTDIEILSISPSSDAYHYYR